MRRVTSNTSKYKPTIMGLRIKSRMDALGYSARGLSIKLGRTEDGQQGYINDIITGKKKSIDREDWETLASLLECDIEYILGLQDVIRRRQGVKYGGVIESGIFQKVGHREHVPGLDALRPDPDFSPEDQIVFLVRGKGADMLGYQPGDVVLAVLPQVITPLTDGTEVITARFDIENDMVETEIRRIETVDGRKMLVRSSSSFTADPILFNQQSNVMVVGVILAIRRSKLLAQRDGQTSRA